MFTALLKTLRAIKGVGVKKHVIDFQGLSYLWARPIY